MLETLLAVGVAFFAIYVIFNVIFVISMQRTTRRIREFVEKTEPTLIQVLDEIKGSVENVKKISSDVREVTADVGRVSHAVADLASGIQNGVLYMEQRLSRSAASTAAGLKAGLRAGVTKLARKTVTRKEKSS